MAIRDNIHGLTIIKRNGEEIKIGYGILTKNPLEITSWDKRWMKYRKLVWLWYGGYWYIVKNVKVKTDVECIAYIQNHKTYSKEQLFDLVYELCETR